MKILSIASIVTFAVSSLVVTGSPVHAIQTTSTECSVAQPNSITFEPKQLLLEGESIGPMSIDLPAGDYTIDYVSYDDHSGHGGQEQHNETWSATVGNTRGAVFSTGNTADIPEDTDIVTGSLGQVSLNQDITSIRIDHSISAENKTNNYESVFPVCVSFTPLVQEEAPCAFDEALKASDENCKEPQVLGAVTPPVTELPNTGVASIALSALSFGGMTAAVKAWIVSKQQ